MGKEGINGLRDEKANKLNIISAEGLWCLAEENCNEDVLTTDNLVVLQLEFASPLR